MASQFEKISCEVLNKSQVGGRNEINFKINKIFQIPMTEEMGEQRKYWEKKLRNYSSSEGERSLE